jgi:hypothetical protein
MLKPPSKPIQTDEANAEAAGNERSRYETYKSIAKVNADERSHWDFVTDDNKQSQC